MIPASMKTMLRKMTVAEAKAESEAVLKAHAAMIAEWYRRNGYKSAFSK